MQLAPICLFTYNRLEETKKTVTALQQNYLASECDLVIFSDGWKREIGKEKIENVRNFLKTISGFKSVTIKEFQTNRGLANSIIDGVSEVLKTHDSVIVLEDDLVSSLNFLNFMNESLNFYRDEPKVFSISGFSIPIETDVEIDVYFTQRSSSWGWATWKNRWDCIDWNVLDYESFKRDRTRRKLFNRMGSDLSSMLDKQINGQLDSWAIRWCYHQFKFNLFSVHPIVSKIQNIGFTPDATNTIEKYTRYKTSLDSNFKTEFIFSKVISLDKKIINQFVHPFTLLSRFKYKLLNFFSFKFFET